MSVCVHVCVCLHACVCLKKKIGTRITASIPKQDPNTKKNAKKNANYCDKDNTRPACVLS